MWAASVAEQFPHDEATAIWDGLLGKRIEQLGPVRQTTSSSSAGNGTPWSTIRSR